MGTPWAIAKGECQPAYQGLLAWCTPMGMGYNPPTCLPRYDHMVTSPNRPPCLVGPPTAITRSTGLVSKAWESASLVAVSFYRGKKLTWKSEKVCHQVFGGDLKYLNSSRSKEIPQGADNSCQLLYQLRKCASAGPSNPSFLPSNSISGALKSSEGVWEAIWRCLLFRDLENSTNPRRYSL